MALNNIGRAALARRCAVALLAATVPAYHAIAQSPSATGDVPRMSASVDPAEAARPDLSGVWTTYTAPGEQRLLFGQDLKLPYTEEGKRRRDEYEKLARGPTGSGENPGAHCVTYGMPGTMELGGTYPLEFIQRSDQLTIIFEVMGEIRRIYFAPRGLPPERRVASRQGYSSGRWEGDTLVVETTDLDDGVDQLFRPHSDQATIVERFTLGRDAEGKLILTDAMTITDPVFYTQPVTTELKWTPAEDGYMLPYPCMEEVWVRLLDARRAQLNAGEPITAKIQDVMGIYD